MDPQRKDRRGDFLVVIVAAFVAVVSQIGILFNDFGPGDGFRGSGSTTMVTAAAVSRAGAMVAPIAEWHDAARGPFDNLIAVDRLFHSRG